MALQFDIWILLVVAVMFLMVVAVIAALLIGKRTGSAKGRKFIDMIYGREGTYIGLEAGFEAGCKHIRFKPTGSLFHTELITDVPTTGYKTIDSFHECCPQEGFFILFNDGKQHMTPTLFDSIGGENMRKLSQTLHDERESSQIQSAAERMERKLLERGSDEGLKSKRKLFDELERRKEISKRDNKFRRNE